jgi:hypothetical protein
MERSRFMLAPAGERLLAVWGPPTGNGHAHATPRWDAGRRQLWYGERLVKVLRNPARNQETILAAFDEDGWPPRIDDPLPVVPNIHPHERLHEAVRGLNTGRVSGLVEFRRDGTGAGVVWWCSSETHLERTCRGDTNPKRERGMTSYPR